MIAGKYSRLVFTAPSPFQAHSFAAHPPTARAQEYVRKDIIDWLNFLRKDVGYDGWRFDFVRGWPGHFAKMYIEATEPAFALGEYWDCCEYVSVIPDDLAPAQTGTPCQTCCPCC